MKTKYICNPFYIYVCVFSLSYYLFSLQWSNLYPDLELELFLFLLLTFIVSLILGIVFDNVIRQPVFKENFRSRKIDYVYIFIIISIFIEFIYNKGVPILQISAQYYDYRSFGIKTFHVVVFTLASFYTLYLFEQLFYSRNFLAYFKFLSLYLYPLLLVNRGAFLMTSTGIVFIYLMSKEKISVWKIAFIGLLLLLLMYLFGVLGSLRENDENFMMEHAKPTVSFIESNIPKEFMWAYIYASSPIATLQLNVSELSDYRVDEYLIGSVAPDFLSNRIVGEGEKIEIKQLASWLTVGTTYSKAYASMGWYGLLSTYILMSISIFLYPFIVARNNKYYASGYSVLLVIVVYSIFSNMWVFAGLSLQLVYPYILNKIERIRF